MHRPKPLQFDKRKDKWSADKPTTALQDWAARDDDYHVGFLAGMVVSGVLSTVVYGLALALS